MSVRHASKSDDTSSLFYCCFCKGTHLSLWGYWGTHTCGFQLTNIQYRRNWGTSADINRLTGLFLASVLSESMTKSTEPRLLLPAGSLGASVKGIWTGRHPERWSQSRVRRLKRGGRVSAGAALRRKRRRRRDNGSGRSGSDSVSRWSESRCCSRCSGCCGPDGRRQMSEWRKPEKLWSHSLIFSFKISAHHMKE